MLIKAGHVIDPKSEIDQVMDVAIKGDRIAAVEKDIDPAQAKRPLMGKGYM